MGPSHAKILNVAVAFADATVTTAARAPALSLVPKVQGLPADLVYREAAPMLRGLARKVGLPAGDVDDAVQEAFVRFLEAGAFPSIEGARSYLCSAIRCIAIDRFRRASFRKTESAGEDIGGYESRLWSSDVEHDAALASLGAALALVEGRPGGKELAWFYRDGLSLKEICAKTGEPVGTVSARLTRARAKLGPEIRAAVEAGKV